MSEILDLDSIMPQPMTIRLGGKEIVINPPTVAQILVLVRLNSDFMDTDDSNIDAMNEASKKLQDHLRILIPGLPEGDMQAFVQRKLAEQLFELAKPEEMEALDEKGISVDNSKKVPQD